MRSLDKANPILLKIGNAETLQEAALIADQFPFVWGGYDQVEVKQMAQIYDHLIANFGEEISTVYPEAFSGLPQKPRSEELFDTATEDESVKEIVKRDAPGFERYSAAARDYAEELKSAGNIWELSFRLGVFNSQFLADQHPGVRSTLDLLGFEHLGKIQPEIIIELHEAISNGNEVIPVPYLFGSDDETGAFYNRYDIPWVLNRQLKSANRKYLLVPIVADDLASMIRRMRTVFGLLNFNREAERPIGNALVSAHGAPEFIHVGRYRGDWHHARSRQLFIAGRELAWLQRYMQITASSKYFPRNLILFSCSTGDIRETSSPFAASVSRLGASVTAPSLEIVSARDIFVRSSSNGEIEMTPFYSNRGDVETMNFVNGQLTSRVNPVNKNLLIVRRSLRNLERAKELAQLPETNGFLLG